MNKFIIWIMLFAVVVPACSKDSSGDDEFVGTEIGFRILAEDLAEGHLEAVHIANTAADLDELSPGSNLASSVDFTTEVVLVFDLYESTTCPYEEMANLRHDTTTNIVYPVVPIDSGGGDCTDDAGPHRIVVAAKREDLPTDDFKLWLGSPAGPPSEVTVPVVDADTLTFVEQ